MSLSEISATEIARRIKRRDISCLEVTEYFVQEQKRWNPKINAVVENRWSDALEDAREKDRELASVDDPQSLPVLFGVPMTMKEMLQVQGYRSTLGSIHRRRLVQTRDASVVGRMRQAGVTILGTTNVPELGFWFECENPVYGRTVNPFDLTRTAGGSSGGEAAMIAAGGSPIGLGSDVGGSIRMPAGMCGVFGHKPSNRIVPITGHYPASFDVIESLKDPRYPLTCLGPLARSSEDLWTIMRLLIGPDGLDQEVKRDFKLGAPVEDWSDATVWILPEPSMMGVGGTSNTMAQAVRLAGSYFESLGARVREMKPDVLRNAAFLWSAGLSEVQGRTFEVALFNEGHANLPVEIFRSLFGIRNYTMPALMTVVTERLMGANKSEWEGVNAARVAELHAMREKFNALLRGKNIFILPTHPREAPKNGSTVRRPLDFAMTGVFNALGLPATAAPVSWENDLPQSVQIISAWGQDHMTLSAAQVLESGFGGSRRPAFPT